MTLSQRPLVHPQRKVTGFRPLKAMRHFGKLVADKEVTEQVFHIIDALKGRKSVRQMADFMATPQSKMLLERGEELPPLLDDHARWADCAPGSLAAHYVAFMQREGLSAAGLVAESHKYLPPEARHDDLYEWYVERLRDPHDLFHVLTGYGRDPLGELCLLGFSYEQNHSPGVLFIAWMGARQMAKETGMKAPIMAALAEGRALGRAAHKLAHADLLTMLPDDIEAVRARLNVGKPQAYRACLAMLNELPGGEGGWQDQAKAA